MKVLAAQNDLLERFERRLTEQERAAVAVARDWAGRNGTALYAVGGTVRDLLLGRKHLDLDLAVDGESAALAVALGATLSAEVTTHPHFGTAEVAAGGLTVDIARTRSELYRYPGALPEVAPAPIEVDLARRDFTVHALALELCGDVPGRLIGPETAPRDLEAGLLRGLHDATFRDDPTRILRLARYAARLDFGIESGTEMLAHRDATFLAAASPARITHELERTCLEPCPEQSFLLLQRLNALVAIYPAFRVTDGIAGVFDRLRSDGGSTPAFTEYLAAIAAPWDRTAIQGLAGVLELRAEAIAALRDLPSASALFRTLRGDAVDPVVAVDRLSRLSLAAARAAAAAGGGAAARIMRRYLSVWQRARPELNGNDLIALGVPVGPSVGEALALLRAGRLRHELTSADDERALVARWLRSGRVQEGKVR